MGFFAEFADVSTKEDGYNSHNRYRSKHDQRKFPGNEKQKSDATKNNNDLPEKFGNSRAQYFLNLSDVRSYSRGEFAYFLPIEEIHGHVDQLFKGLVAHVSEGVFGNVVKEHHAHERKDTLKEEQNKKREGYLIDVREVEQANRLFGLICTRA